MSLYLCGNGLNKLGHEPVSLQDKQFMCLKKKEYRVKILPVYFLEPGCIIRLEAGNKLYFLKFSFYEQFDLTLS